MMWTSGKQSGKPAPTSGFSLVIIGVNSSLKGGF